MLIVDAHEDLAWNILTFQRDYTQSAIETRRKEAATSIPQRNGDTLLGYPEYQSASVAVIFSTLFAAPLRRKMGEWDTQCYRDAKEAQKLYRSQVDLYRKLSSQYPDKFQILYTKKDLAALLDHWQYQTGDHPVGLVMLMEGAEGILQPAQVADWWDLGVRLIGPAWAGNGYCGGTGEPGGLTKLGYELLEHMAELGMILDLSHMDEKAALQALDTYPGSIIASHANAIALLKGSESNRHLSDTVIQRIIERNGVIGVVPFNVFLKVGWKTGDSREEVTLNHVVAQIDHICQIAGNTNHAALGTDFDGGFGKQSVPLEIDTIADLQKIGDLLQARGYSQKDCEQILGKNWLNILMENLPE